MASDSDGPFKSEADELNEFSILGHPETRREFIKQVAGTSAAVAIGPSLISSASLSQVEPTSADGAASDSVNVHLIRSVAGPGDLPNPTTCGDARIPMTPGADFSGQIGFFCARQLRRSVSNLVTHNFPTHRITVDRG